MGSQIFLFFFWGKCPMQFFFKLLSTFFVFAPQAHLPCMWWHLIASRKAVAPDKSWLLMSQAKSGSCKLKKNVGQDQPQKTTGLHTGQSRVARWPLLSDSILSSGFAMVPKVLPKVPLLGQKGSFPGEELLVLVEKERRLSHKSRVLLQEDHPIYPKS